jgi:hypothetical protein
MFKNFSHSLRSQGWMEEEDDKTMFSNASLSASISSGDRFARAQHFKTSRDGKLFAICMPSN